MAAPGADRQALLLRQVAEERAAGRDVGGGRRPGVKLRHQCGGGKVDREPVEYSFFK
jgi:hypothetical protein